METTFAVIFGVASSKFENESWILCIYLISRKPILVTGLVLIFASCFIFSGSDYAACLSGISPILDLHQTSDGQPRLNISSHIRLLYGVTLSVCLLRFFTKRIKRSVLTFGFNTITRHIDADGDDRVYQLFIKYGHQLIIFYSIALQTAFACFEYQYLTQSTSEMTWWMIMVKCLASLIHIVCNYTLIVNILMGVVIVTRLASRLRQTLDKIADYVFLVNVMQIRELDDMTQRCITKAPTVTVIISRLVRFIFTVQSVSSLLVGQILLLHTVLTSSCLSVTIYTCHVMLDLSIPPTPAMYLMIFGSFTASIVPIVSLWSAAALYRHTARVIPEICLTMLIKSRDAHHPAVKLKLTQIWETFAFHSSQKIGMRCALVSFTVTSQYLFNVS